MQPKSRHILRFTPTDPAKKIGPGGSTPTRRSLENPGERPDPMQSHSIMINGGRTEKHPILNPRKRAFLAAGMWLSSAVFLCRSAFGAESPAPSTPTAIPALQKKVDFETNVLPILKRNCLACHNATDAEGDLVLETPATILKGGEDGPVVVPHKGMESLLLQSSARTAKPHMPPKNNKVGAEIMKPEELAILRAWIDQGATGTVNAKPKPVQWHPLPPGLHPILAVAVSKDGQFAACGRANQIFVYHIPTGQMVARLTDPKLAEKTGRSGYRSSAQRDFVQSLAFSPDGRILASGEYRMVKLWQREPNLPQFTLGADPIGAIATSPDGKWLATAGRDHVIRIWDAATGAKAKELAGHTGTVSSLRFSPDNRQLASGSADKTLRIWDLAAGKLLAQIETPVEISAVAWALGGKQIATAGADSEIRLWLPQKAGEAITAGQELKGHTKPVTALEATADGKQLVSGSSDGSVRIWDVAGAKELRKMDHSAPVAAVAIAPNGKTIASVGGPLARLWSADKGQQLAEMKGDPRARAQVKQGEQAAAFAKSEAAFWKSAQETAVKAQTAKADVSKKAQTAFAAAEKSAAEAAEAATKAADEKAKETATAAAKKAATAKSTADKARLAAEAALKEADQAVADAKAGGESAAAALQKAESEIERAKKLAADSEKPLRAIAFAPSGLAVATAGDDQIIHTWSAKDGAPFDTFTSQLGSVQTLGYMTDGRLISCAAKNGGVVWRSGPTWTLARTIGSGDEKSPLVSRVVSLAFSPDGQSIATGGGAPSRNGEVKIWRSSDGALIREIPKAHSDTVFAVDFSPDGKRLATASADKFVKIFETSTGKLIKTLSGHTHYVLGVSWRADGRLLASSGADKVVKLWTFPSGEQLKTVEGFNKEVTSVHFVGLGGELLTTSGDTKVRTLKEDGAALRDYAGGKGFIFSAAITPDGETVLGGGQDSVLRIWKASDGKSLFNLDPPAPEASVKTVSAAPK